MVKCAPVGACGHLADAENYASTHSRASLRAIMPILRPMAMSTWRDQVSVKHCRRLLGVIEPNDATALNCLVPVSLIPLPRADEIELSLRQRLHNTSRVSGRWIKHRIHIHQSDLAGATT